MMMSEIGINTLSEEKDNCISDYLSKLFYRIKNLNITTYEIIYNELLQLEKKNFSIIDYYEYSMFILLDNNIYSNYTFAVFNVKTLNPILSFYNNILLDEDAITELSKYSWNASTIEITKYSLESKHFCLFNHNNIWYIAYKPNIIVELYSDDNVAKICATLCKNKIDTLNSNYIYHLLIKHNNFRKIGHSDDKYNPCITLLWTCDKNLNIIENVESFNYEKRYYFSCMDELIISLESLGNDDIINKFLSCGGYHVRIKTNNMYICCFLRTKIYKHILLSLPSHDNKHRNYLELYQNNLLGDILPYLHKYSADVVRRINIAIKILSKEILNIYHLTRKKQNSDLYECLSQTHKKILYDLHKIYVNQKYGEYIIKSHDILKEKKSISVDIVYNYLKHLQNSELLQIFIDRKLLIRHLDTINYNYNNILSVNNIDIITQIELMSL
jgi:hypothetical protein